MYAFKLPDVGEGIHEAELLEWRVAVGDRVKEGDEIAVINTDKITVELPSPRAGVIVATHGTVGDIIEVGTVLVDIEQERGAESAAKSSKPAKAGIFASPAVRRLAKDLGVDLSTMQGSGTDGRILRGDVEAAGKATAGSGRRVPLSGARAVAARQLAASIHTSVTTTTSFEALGDGLRQAMETHQLSPLPLIAKCLGATLSRHERFNATIDEADSALIPHESVDLGIAVAAKEGLVVPVIRGIEQSPVEAVAEAIERAAARARAGQLQSEDLKGGSFTLSSTGGLEKATVIATRPIINPPQTAILWVSRIMDRPRVVAGELQAGPMLALSLSFDHRYIDGAEATYFINDLVSLLEEPKSALD
jgi:pyruvate/2-oxoglutarate dehydrogenase complex dihydrolipoamide acyltransferase (E2) component